MFKGLSVLTDILYETVGRYEFLNYNWLTVLSCLEGLGANVSYQRNWVIQKPMICFRFFFSELGLESEISRYTTKNQPYMLFCLMFPDFKLVLCIFTTHFTTKCITWLFHLENYIDSVDVVKSVESISRINRKSEDACEIQSHLLWVLLGDFSTPGRSQGLLYKHLPNWFIN